MATDPSLLSALLAAVGAEPGNLPLRVHVAEVLIGAGDPVTALVHLEVVLGQKPDDVAALLLASRAAEESGDSSRAESWRRLHRALEGTDSDITPMVSAPTESPSKSEFTDFPVPAIAGPEEDDWDISFKELLQEQGYWDRITLDDVGGLEDVKRQIQVSFLGPLRNPELRRAYGASLRGGLLLWGPPGCGKTFLARAIAGELGAHFASVGLNDVLDMWLGNSEKQLHSLFEAARRSSPCVLFFDELDAVGHKRTDLGRSASRNVVAQLLTEMDGIGSENDGVFVLGATNQPWDVDAALRRPGRFDRTVLVLPPDAPARESILRYHLRDRPTDITSVEEVVRITDGFSGADLRLACDDATHRALGDAVDSGQIRAINSKDLVEACRHLRPSTRTWFETAGNFARYSNASGEYDDLVTHMRAHRLG